MKRILLYMLMALSVAVFAQQQAGDSAGNNDEEQAPTEQPADAAQDSEDEAPEASARTGNGIEAEAHSEQRPDTGQHGEDESLAASGETDPDDSDFQPGEEISEDYPVPLPSDI